MSCTHTHEIFIDLLLFSGFREDVVRESFLKLLNAHFVERCPAPEPFLPAPVKAETTKKRGAKSAKVIVDSCQIYLLVIVCCTEAGVIANYSCIACTCA